ncbi:MAG TPA: dicarboxylate/amino acid:cation symporter [Kofleriaceae bacterium]|nr:dicarboxylate/amino acid:cation symporter [Kofleriaceae bacterium]
MLRSLYFWVLVAIVAGIVVGVAAPDVAAQMQPLSEGFIKLVRMVIAPLIFCTVVVGIAGMKDVKSAGKAGGLAILYFEIVSTIALVIGLVVVNVVKPGAGMHIDPAKIPQSDLAKVAKFTSADKLHGVKDFLLDIIPDTFVGAFTRGDLLPVLVIALLFAFALGKSGERGKPVLELIDRIGHVMFGVVAIILRAAPIGAFGAMAFTVGTFGADKLVYLLELMACFYATCLIFLFGVLEGVARVHGFSAWRFIAYIRSELLIVLGTSSSESVLPRMMTKLDDLGADKRVVDLVIPAGYSFNLDGTAIYLTMAAIFVAQATDIPIDLWHQLALVGVLLLTSKGAAGVSGSGFIVLASTLSVVGDVPLAGLAIILGIDRFMSEARALTNVCGNGIATLVVARWCNALDLDRVNAKLRGDRSSSPA